MYKRSLGAVGVLTAPAESPPIMAPRTMEITLDPSSPSIPVVQATTTGPTSTSNLRALLPIAGAALVAYWIFKR